MVHTRYLRITFTRRDEAWPTGGSAPFEWPVFAKHLRLGRAVSGLLDTVGPLLTQDTPLGIDQEILESIGDDTREVRQQFTIPTGSVRAGITPRMLGFGVLISTTRNPNDPVESSAFPVEYAWSVWDVTNAAAPEQLVVGLETGAVTLGLSWLDWYLDESFLLQGDINKIYELRVHSKQPLVSNIVYTHTPNVLSTRTVPGTVTFTNSSSLVTCTSDPRDVVSVGSYVVRADVPDQVYRVNAVTGSDFTLNVAYTGVTTSGATANVVYPFSAYDNDAHDYVADGSKNLVMRVWADVADEGRDVLGNSYRYVTRPQPASAVTDPTHPGWMSDPSPSPDAVEALYFDVRGRDEETNEYIMSVIEAISIAPRTPGVRMNVYYSQQNVGGEKPGTTNDWDYLLWKPVQETYTLRRDETIELPHAIRAAFVKLEFSGLNPLPYRIPTYPALPPKVFRRFPTWVEDQFNNSAVRNVIEDWFLRSSTPVETKILASMSDPTLEFEYKQREFLAALALGKIQDTQIVNSGLVDIADRAIIDPVTASKVFVSFDNQYQNTLLLSVDQESTLGQMVVARFDPTLITDQNERVAGSVVAGDVPVVSTTNNRLTESYQNLARVPMRFNKTSRHVYTQEQAEFNKKAYFVGIEKVRFLRNNYAVKHDDAIIPDNLYDDAMLLENTFQAEEGTSIPTGEVVYVSYSINPDIVDEVITLAGFSPVPLSVTGSPARNVVVYSQPNKQGLQFFQDQDYELSYGTDENGSRVTYIQRSSFGQRLAAPLQTIVYVDAGTVIGRGVIPSPPTIDVGVVTGVGVVSATHEGPPVPTYGINKYGTGTYGDLFGTGIVPTVDTATVIGRGVITSTDFASYVDAATVVGVGVIGDPITADANTVVGRSVISGVEATDFADAASIIAVGVPSGVEISTGGDLATVTGRAVLSAVENAIFVDTGFASARGVPATALEQYIPAGGGGTHYEDVQLIDSPTHQWAFWDASGTVAADTSGNGRDGTYHGALSLGLTSILDFDPSAKAVGLNGSGQYISRATEATLNSVTWCAEVVFEVTGGTSTFRCVMTTRDESTNFGWLLYVNDTNKIELRMNDSVSGTRILTGTTPIAINTPYHAICGFDNATGDAVIYLNGALEATANHTHDTGPSSLGIRFGQRMDGAFIAPVLLQGFAHYASVLNSTRALDHYNALSV